MSKFQLFRYITKVEILGRFFLLQPLGISDTEIKYSPHYGIDYHHKLLFCKYVPLVSQITPINR